MFAKLKTFIWFVSCELTSRTNVVVIFHRYISDVSFSTLEMVENLSSFQNKKVTKDSLKQTESYGNSRSATITWTTVFFPLRSLGVWWNKRTAGTLKYFRKKIAGMKETPISLLTMIFSNSCFFSRPEMYHCVGWEGGSHCRLAEISHVFKSWISFSCFHTVEGK